MQTGDYVNEPESLFPMLTSIEYAVSSCCRSIMGLSVGQKVYTNFSLKHESRRGGVCLESW